MKLTWKIFFSTLAITILTFSVGGYLLITSLFSSALSRESNAASEDDEMLRNYFRFVVPTLSEKEEDPNYVWETILENFTGHNRTVQLYDENYNLIAGNSNPSADKEFLEQAKDDSLIYTITTKDNRYYLKTLSVLHAFDGKFFIEGYRDVTSLYTDRKVLFSIYKRVLVFLLIIHGVLVFLMTWFTVSPIKNLIKTTKAIAKGRYDKRAVIKTRDEVGLLASDFNQMADNLEAKIHDLEAANIRQQDFIGSFAHELKTPLTSIIGYADMLRSKRMSDEDKVLAADYIFKEGRRLESLSFKLLELLVVKNLHFEMKRVPIKELFKDVDRIMEPILQDGGISLHVTTEDVFLSLEPDLMKTLLLNLLDNARKAIPSKGKITLRGSKSSHNRFTISVEDTGKGIPENELQRIKEAFYMVDKSRARAEGGAGLGLALCQEIAELHGGDMEFSSIPNIGTTVYVDMPISNAE